MHISGKKKAAPPHLVLNNKTIDCVSKAKLLGVTIQDNLRWDNNIENSCKKACKLLFPILQLRRSSCNIGVLINLYCAMVRPHLVYAYPALCNMTAQNMQSLIKVERRFYRLIGAKPSENIISFCHRIAEKLKDDVLGNEEHPLRQLLMPRPSRTLRSDTHMTIRGGRSALYTKSFIRYFIK